jgi:mono/diheme cytochrome c family protein
MRTDSSNAGEVARAPRANPAAPTPGPAQVTPPSTPSKPTDTPSAASGSATLRDKYHQPPKDTVSQVVYTGWKQFNLNCARCHGEDVTGTTIAPHLIESFRSGKVDHTEFWNVVHGSRMAKGMPNWSGVIPDDQLEAIYQYVKARSDGKVGPGRPAVKGG